MKIILSFILFFMLPIATAATLDEKVRDTFQDHFNKYTEKEYFSGATLSYSIPGQPIKTFYAGKVSHDPKSAPVSANTLFQIGSITKSFTTVLLLKAQENNRLHLDDSFVKWLPEYKNWPHDITIRQLVDMTANLPNYSDTPLWYAQMTKDLQTQWTSRELIAFVYPEKPNIPLRTGYFYSNTGYILAELILEKATRTSFVQSMQKLLQNANLNNTFYPFPVMEKAIHERMAHGYNYNPYDNPALVGKDIYNSNLSWAASAGGMLSNSEDVVRWVQQIFIDKQFLSNDQKKQLQNLHSTSTGKPVLKVSDEDQKAFGLGIASKYEEGIGNIWYYEGTTLGFRAFYLFNPRNNVIISVIFNSTPDKQNNAINKLMKSVYGLISIVE